jgi:hypothetical protein
LFSTGTGDWPTPDAEDGAPAPPGGDDVLDTDGPDGCGVVDPVAVTADPPPQPATRRIKPAGSQA